jgi:hypothetical protein
VNISKSGIVSIWVLMLLVPGVVTFAAINSVKQKAAIPPQQPAPPVEQAIDASDPITPVTQEEGSVDNANPQAQLEEAQAAARIRREAGEKMNWDGHYDILEDNFANFKPAPPAAKVDPLTVGKYINRDDLVFLDPRFFGDGVASQRLSGSALVRGDASASGTIVLAQFSDYSGHSLTAASNDERLARAVSTINNSRFSGQVVDPGSVDLDTFAQPNIGSITAQTFPMYKTTGFTKDGDCIAQYVILTESSTVHIAKISIGTNNLSCPVTHMNSKLRIISESEYERFRNSP